MPPRLPVRSPVLHHLLINRAPTTTTTASAAAAAIKHIIPPGTLPPPIRPSRYRYIHTTKSAMMMNADDSQQPPEAARPVFSRDVADVDALSRKVEPLLTQNGGRWTLAKEGEALEREFRFKGFAKCWDFMTAVSLQCKVRNHHPEWSNVYNTTFIRWTTHSPKGLSVKDVELAAACDALASDFGEVVEEERTESCEVKGLADRVAGAAGDCCVPKSAKK